MKYSEFLNKLGLEDEQAIKDLAAVSQNGYALEYVKNKTPEICLAAVNQNGLALQFVKNQTPELCLAAVNQNGNALKYIDKSIFEKE